MNATVTAILIKNPQGFSNTSQTLAIVTPLCQQLAEKYIAKEKGRPGSQSRIVPGPFFLPGEPEPHAATIRDAEGFTPEEYENIFFENLGWLPPFQTKEEFIEEL